MAIRWNTEKEEKLIALIYDTPAIWNKSLDQQKFTHVIGDLWEKISKQMKVSKDQARNKWKNLQTAYNKELAKQPKTRSGDAARKTKSSWPHFESMSFLKENNVRESSGNLDAESDLESDYEEKQNLSGSSNGDSQIADQKKPEDADSKADWQFLLSTLPFMDRISGKNKKRQFRVEAYCLLFNFATDNEIKKINKLEKPMKEVGKPVKEVVKKERADEQNNLQDKEQHYLKQENIKHKKLNVKQEIEENNDATSTTCVQKKDKKTMQEVIDVEPSDDVKMWLVRNCFALKKEIP